MAFVPFPPGVVEVHLNGSIDGVAAQNVLGAKFFTGAATPTDGTALATAIIASFVANNWFTNITSNYILNDVEIIDLTSASGWTADVAAGKVGTATGPAVQSQVAMVVTLQTARRGRSYRGRNFVAGLPTSALIDSKSWNLAAIATWEALYADLLFDMQAAGWTPVVLSRIQGKVPLGTGVATPIVGQRANEKLGTIRGRLT